MPVNEPNQFQELWHTFREWVPSLKPRAIALWDQVRDDPQIVLESKYFRLGLIALGGIVILVIGSLVSSWIAPGGSVDTAPRAKTANFEVFCSDSACGHHFLINRPFGFHKFPVECPKCKHKTGRRAVRCDSDQCRGRMVPTVEANGEIRCVRCGFLIRQE